MFDSPTPTVTAATAAAKPPILARFATVLALLLCALAPTASHADPRYYDRGTPLVQDIWVDPVAGNNANSGATRAAAVKTLVEAWGRIPMATMLTTTGYRINLVAGTYPQVDVPNYFESRWGTFAFPVMIEAADGAGTARLPALNIFDCRYLYLLGLHVSQGGGDVLHCDSCDHFLLNAVTVRGAAPATFAVQEAVKVNQSQYVYVEDSDISGAWDNSVDFVAVQFGHLQGNRIYDSGDWCLYTKGGSTGFRIEGNEFYDCGNGGYTAGQGTGFEYMTSPWLHYETYDVRFINNVIHDTGGAGFGVNGGYNILLAYNTLYRIGSISHILELVYGARSCDGDTSACAANLSAGGWGTAGAVTEPIPNRNVFVYNNVFYNPAPFLSQWQQFAIFGPQTPSPTSHIPSPARADTNAQIRGNVIWNGPLSHPLGIEESGEGCQPSNPTCNATQLVADNAFNTIEPAFVNAAGGDFHPVTAGNLYSATTFGLPSFPGGDLPSPPVITPGDLANTVTRDFTGAARGPSSPPGAYGADCSSAVCGDGTHDLGCESCDDGDLVSGDGCDSNCTVTDCGNGITTTGESCDDGNSSDGDGCDHNCTATACGNGVVSSGEQCDDGNLAPGDACDATCSLDCPTSPSLSCHTASSARASSLRILDAPGTAKDAVIWKVKGLADTSLASFGDPTASTSFLLCLYETAAETPSIAIEALVPSAADCGVPGCWSASSSSYGYASAAAGKMSLQLRVKPGAVGSIALSTRAVAAFATSLPLGQDPAVTLQLRSSNGECWSAGFSGPASRNDAGQFKDLSD